MNGKPLDLNPALVRVNQWLEVYGEVYIEVYYPRTGGGSDYLFVYSLSELKRLLSILPRNAELTVYQQKQLPLRGIADDSMLVHALMELPDGVNWFMLSYRAGDPHDMAVEQRLRQPWVRNCVDDNNMLCDAVGGSSHLNLEGEFGRVRGQYVAIGLEPPSWHETDKAKMLTLDVDDL